MKNNYIVISILFSFSSLLNLEALAESESDYKKIFAGESWQTSEAFLSWATPLTNLNRTKAQCSHEIKNRLADSAEKILFCEQVAKVGLDNKEESAQIVYSIRRTATPSDYGHDCRVGMSYVDKEKIILGNDPANCLDAQNIVNPSAKPIMVFRVNLTGEIGIVFDGHGAECGGRAVVRQHGSYLEWVHRLYWRCMH